MTSGLNSLVVNEVNGLGRSFNLPERVSLYHSIDPFKWILSFGPTSTRGVISKS